MLTFNVPDMSCGHCAKAITEAVKELDASADVQVDIEAKRVTIKGQSASADAIAAAITEAGYTPEAVA